MEDHEKQKESNLSFDMEKIKKIASKITIDDTTFVLNYGLKTQEDISRFTDKVLEHVIANDLEEVGSVLTDLMIKVNEVNMDKLFEKGGITSIPFLGKLFNKTKKFIQQFEKISIDVEGMTQDLHRTQIRLMKDITLFEQLYVKNKTYINELSDYIEAAHMKLKEIHENIMPELKEKAERTKEPKDIQAANEMIDHIDRFDKKIHNLLLSKTIATQIEPQIRLLQSNNEILAEKIQNSILQTIPLWKQQLIISLSLVSQRKAVNLQKKVTKTTNDLLLKNSESVRRNTIDLARESEKGIIEIETLKNTQAHLIATLEDTLSIQEEGRLKRQQTEAEILSMEQELKEKLSSFVGDQT